METLQRFASTTKRLAGRLAESGTIRHSLVPFAAGLLFGSFKLSDLIGAGSFGGFILPAFGLAFICALWCSGMNAAVTPAAIGVAAGSVLAGQYTGAVGAALFAAPAIILLYKPYMIRLYRFALLLGAMLLMLPGGILLGAWRELSPTDVLVHLGGCSLTLLAAAIETRGLSAVGPLRSGADMTDEQTVAASFLAGIAALALSRFRVFGFGFGTAFAAAVCLIAADSKGAAAVASAAIIAAMRVLGTAGDMLFIAVLCCCTLTASLFRSFGKLGTAAGFTVPAVLFFALIPGGGSIGVGEILAADAALLLVRIPKKTGERKAALPASRRDFEKQRLLYQNYKLTLLSDVLERIAQLFSEDSGAAEAFLMSQLSGTAMSLERLSDSRITGAAGRARFGIRIGSACIPKADGEIPGDSRLIRDFDGQYLAVISDGMGSGSTAARESGQAVQLLADLVTCGFPIAQAADCVNRLLLLRGDGEMYATLDALLLDPVKGKLHCAKHGSPPGYLLRRGEVRELYAEALPVGIIADAKAAISCTDLRRGDAVIMMSDGASEAIGKDLSEAIGRIVPENEPEDAAKLLAELAAQQGGRDDATVIVAKAI